VSNAEGNPFLPLSPAAVDVLDDMVDAWLDRDRHGELGYGPAKTAAFSELYTLVHDAWKVRVNYRNVEESEA
jgi:hypothetical protein